MSGLRLGCSGWDYQEWVGPFYKSASESKLAAYARVFDTAEINSTFYRPPTPGMVHGWNRHTPETFRFTAKVPQSVTHDRLLDPAKGAVEELAAYCELMRPLIDAGKLGPLLLQLPPRLRYSGSLRGFLASLKPEFTWALEPRNKTWMVEEAFDALREHGITYCIVDEPLLPPVLHVTAKTAYIRWHGHGRSPWYNYRYTEEELRTWVPKVHDVLSKAEHAYGFFNNHYGGFAPENALQLTEMLGLEPTPAQAGAARRIAGHRKGIVRTSVGTVKRTTLEDFGSEPPPAAGALEGMLSEFADPGRLGRGRRIAAKKVTLERDEHGITARIAGYSVFIDVEEKRLVHDCEDWATQLRDRRFCKHVVRVVLELMPEEAVPILSDLREHRRDWTFALPEP